MYLSDSKVCVLLHLGYSYNSYIFHILSAGAEKVQEALVKAAVEEKVQVMAEVEKKEAKVEGLEGLEGMEEEVKEVVDLVMEATEAISKAEVMEAESVKVEATLEEDSEAPLFVLR